MRGGIALALLAAGLGCSTGEPAPVCGHASTGQLDTGADAVAAVSPDETRVAFIRDAQTVEAGCQNRGAMYTMGTLAVATLQAGGSFCTREVARNVMQTTVAFTDDSRGLAFRQVDECGRGDLRTADADGGNVRLVARSVHSSTVIGSAVAYEADSDPTDFAVPVAGGAPVSLTWQNLGLGPFWFVSPTGKVFARTTDGTDGDGVASGSLVLVDLSSGGPRLVVDGAQEGAGFNFLWSRRGGWLAFPHYPLGDIDKLSLALVAADGTSRTEVSGSCGCRLLAFSPDDSWLAYDEPDSSGGTRIMTHSLRDGSNVALGVIPADDSARVIFSDDGLNVIAMARTPPSELPSLYAATPGRAGSMLLLLPSVGIGGTGSPTAAGGHVAFVGDPPALQVLPVSGGAPVTLDGAYPQFEPGVSDPHLLFGQSDPPAVSVARGDGTGPVTQTLPESPWSYSWLGSTVVYVTGTSTRSLVVGAVSNGGTVLTELARGASAYAWAPIPAPTHLFYSRATAGPDGPTGLWSVDLSAF